MRQELLRASTGQNFGTLLRLCRAEAGLTQEELAERAGLSRRGIADLERGARLAPHAHTVERLADALGLSDTERDALIVAARPRLAGRAIRTPEQNLVEGETATAATRDGLAPDAALRGLQTVFIREMLRHLIGRDFATVDEVRGGLISLSDDCKRLLSIASVIGHQFELEILTEVADLTDQQVLVLLEEAQRMRVIEEISQPHQVQFRFVHTLVHQTFAEDLLAARRAFIERRVHQALQRRVVKARAERAAEFGAYVARPTDIAHLEIPLHYADVAVTTSAQLPNHIRAKP